MKINAIRNALIAAAVLVLAFAAACGDTPGTPNVFAPEPEVIPMEPVAPGSFTLGQNLGTGGGTDITQLTPVTLTQGFYMSRYPITREQWITVMAGNPNDIPVPHLDWSDAPANQQEDDAGFDIDHRPVTHVSWYDAIVFANRLSIMRGLTPAYELPDDWPTYTSWSSDPDTWGDVPTISNVRWNNVQIADSSDGYRPPTEAQWEFAAKGGNTVGEFTFSGNDNHALVAWTLGNSGGSPRMVGLLDANGLGIYDMSGNVWEWMQNWWAGGLHPAGGPQYDPPGAVSGSLRVVRGGCWDAGPNSARSVVRGGLDPSSRWNEHGFRLARPQ
ncbi:MAG: formylglycine-generating enzyme family protein [Treponema sp.]|nr:formylglycine-generating enzyme family protein [Treponema sp.]